MLVSVTSNMGRECIANLAVIAGVCAAVLGVVLFVLLYEEPHLRKTFDAEYEEYCKNVHRWVPRMRAWNQ